MNEHSTDLSEDKKSVAESMMGLTHIQSQWDRIGSISLFLRALTNRIILLEELIVA
jgi:hypothetical protein